MKKILLPLLFLTMAVFSSQATLFYYEGYPYVDGRIDVTGTNTDGSTNWFRHSGTTDDAFVNNHKEEVGSSDNVDDTRRDDVNRPFGTSSGNAYASFTVNVTNLPSAVGSYFAAFKDDSNTNFVGRVFALTGVSTGAGPTNFARLPSTFRIGVANGSNAANLVFPVDLALNSDYQVVVQYDTGNGATLWINPTNSDDTSIAAGDIVSGVQASISLSSFSFRQGAGIGNFFSTISNLATADSFIEAATNVWKTTPLPPKIPVPPVSTTNFVGDVGSLFTIANAPGLRSLSYQWRKNSNNVANPAGNTNYYPFASAATSDSGNYDVIVTAWSGLRATSSVAFFWVTNPPIPPVFLVQPSNAVVYQHQSQKFTAMAAGSGSESYAWFYNNSVTPLSDGLHFSNTLSTNLVIIDADTNNGTAGIYRCDASNVFGTRTGSNATLTVLAPIFTNLSYIRSLVDPTFFTPTNTSVYWSARGIVTSHDRFTGGANTSFVIQDATAGIDIFIGGGAGITPQAGDDITVVGPLANFNGLLEFSLNVNNLATYIITNSHNNLPPAPIVLPFSFTNGVALGGDSNVMNRIVNSYVMFTNVYFQNPTGAFPGGGTPVMTNSDGGTMRLFFNAATTNLNGNPIPAFAYTVSGVMGYFRGSSTSNTNVESGFELNPTIIDEIQSNAPPQPVGKITVVSGTPKVSWTAVPLYAAYDIYRATTVTGTYVPIATGITTNTTSGSYLDTTLGLDTRFYKILSP